MFVIELIVDIVFNLLTMLDFRSPEKKIKSKMKIVGKYAPGIFQKYKEDCVFFEHGEIAEVILNSPLKTDEQVEELISKIEVYLKNRIA